MNDEDFVMKNRSVETKSKLWLEGLRCFARHWKPWLKWAVCLVGFSVAVAVLKRLGVIDSYIFYITDYLIMPIALLFFFIRQESFEKRVALRRDEMITLLKDTFKIILVLLPAGLAATLMLNLFFILELLGHEVLPDSNVIMPVITSVQLMGAALFWLTTNYFLFRFFQIIILTVNGVHGAFKSGQFLNQGNRWRLFLNYILLFLIYKLSTGVLYFLLDSIIGEKPDVPVAISRIFLISVCQIVGIGIAVAFAYTSTRIFFQEKNARNLTSNSSIH